MSTSRFAIFLSIALSVWALMHLFVFWRLSSVPWVVDHVPRRALWIAAAVLWGSYPLARWLDSLDLRAVAWPLEWVAANWIGTLFLLFAALLATEVLTLGGWALPHLAAGIRGWAALLALVCALVALIQGLRPPVVRDYEVRLAGLPAERDGLVLVEVSDLHLGTLIGRRWMSQLIDRIHAWKPDLIVIVGDLVDGNAGRVEPLRPLLQTLHAPLGVWAVTGNHEYYAGLDRCVRLFEEAGFQVLRDRSAQVVPGLVLAGVDDLTARQQLGATDNAVPNTLAQRPPGATILLSHSPMQASVAAQAGVGLMLSGHTHNGQIWPFSYLVERRYPLLGGRYEVDGMSVVVCRGSGTWGPRMRLWWPSEIVRITLRTDASRS